MGTKNEWDILIKPLLLVYFLASAEYVHAEACSWKVEGVSSSDPGNTMEFLSIFSPFRDVTDLIKDMNMVNLDLQNEVLMSYPHFLKVQVVCNGQVSRTATASIHLKGGHPLVTLTYSPWIEGGKSTGVFTNILHAAFVDIDTYSKPHITCQEGICNPAWLVPFPIVNQSVVYKIAIELVGVAEDWPVYRSTLKLNAFQLQPTADSGGLAMQQVVEEGTLFHKEIQQVCFIPRISAPLALVINKNEHYFLLSWSEFTKKHRVKLAGLETLKQVCHGNTQFTVSTVGDILLISTKYGVLEVSGGGHDSGKASGQVKLVLPHCVELRLPQQSASQQQLVLATEESSARIFVAVFSVITEVEKKWSFPELLSDSGDTACSSQEQLGNTCTVVSAAFAGVHKGQLIVLLKVNTASGSQLYDIVQLQDGQWETLSSIPARAEKYSTVRGFTLLPPTGSQQKELVLHNMAFTQQLSLNVYIWGNALLQSADSGRSVAQLTGYSSDSIIQLFASSSKGHVVFVNDLKEIWLVQSGSTVVTRLYPSASWDLLMEVHCGCLVNMPDMLSVFFDNTDQLILLVADLNASQGVKRYIIPYVEILHNMFHIRTSMLQEETASATSGQRCPFTDIGFIIPSRTTFTQHERLQYHPPALLSPRKGYDNNSMLLYQAVLWGLMDEHRRETNTYEDEFTNHIQSWAAHFMTNQTFAQYLYQNALLHGDMLIDPRDFNQILPPNGTHYTKQLPDTIYLGYGQTYTFWMVIKTLDDHDRSSFLSLDGVSLSVKASNNTLLVVTRERYDFYSNASVVYKITLSDGKNLGRQTLPGRELHPVAFSAQVPESELTCFYRDHADIKQIQGQYHMNVMLGCPPNWRLVFDIDATIREFTLRKELNTDCIFVDKNLPCFNFPNGFYPFFKVVDETTGESWRFTGRYTLKIVGGSSESMDSIVQYTEEEIFEYNNQHSVSGALVWGPANESLIGEDGWPYYSSINNNISWMCQPPSPCSNVMPKFPSSPEFYFLVEISNKYIDINSTHCDYTMRFVLRVNGLPLDPINISLVLVALSITGVVFIVIMFYLCHCNNDMLLNFFRKLFTLRRRVHPTESDMYEMKPADLDKRSREVSLSTSSRATIAPEDEEDNPLVLRVPVPEVKVKPDGYDNDKVEEEMKEQLADLDKQTTKTVTAGESRPAGVGEKVSTSKAHPFAAYEKSLPRAPKQPSPSKPGGKPKK